MVDKGVSLCSYVFLNLGWENQTYVVLAYQAILFYLSGDHFKALDLKNDPFYLVRKWNDKLQKPIFYGRAWLGELILAFSFTLVINQFD